MTTFSQKEERNPMPVHTTYIQLEVDIDYEIDPPEFGLPEQVDMRRVTVTTAHGSGRKQNLLRYINESDRISLEDEILGERA
jgi:hypothetical protein